MATDDDPLDQLDHEERQALAELAQARADGGLSRRQALQAVSALGLGAALGGGGAAALTGSAAADASTSDSDPDVGSPSNRADVFAAGVDANVIDTGRLATSARDPQFVVHEDSGTFYADGPTGLIDSGSDLATVAQAMYDAIPGTAGGPREMYRCYIGVEESADWPSAVEVRGSTVTTLDGYFSVTNATDFLTDGGNSKDRVFVDAYGATVFGNSNTGNGAFNFPNVTVGGVYGARVDAMDSPLNGGKQFVAAYNNFGGGTLDPQLRADSWFLFNDVGTCRRGFRASNKNIHIIGNNLFLNDDSGVFSGNFGGLFIGFNRLNSNDLCGVEIVGGQDDIILVGNRAKNNGQDSGANASERAGYRLDITDSVVGANVAYDDQGAGTQTYGFDLLTGDRNLYGLNNAYGNANSDVTGSLGANSKASVNIPTF